MNAEQYDIIKKAFPNVVVEREGDRVLINHFLAIEFTEIQVRTIGGSRKIHGFVANLDNGEDVVELYKGTSFWSALESCAMELAKFNIRVLADKVDPCVIPVRG